MELESLMELGISNTLETFLIIRMSNGIRIVTNSIFSSSNVLNFYVNINF